MKIAISVITDNNELEAFKYTTLWVLDNDRSRHMLSPLKIWRTFIPGYRIINQISVMLLRRKENAKVPYAILIIGLGNYIYQMIVPSHFDAKSGDSIDLSVPFFPTIFDDDWSFGKPIRSLIDFTGSERIYEDAPIIISFEKIEEHN